MGKIDLFLLFVGDTAGLEHIYNNTRESVTVLNFHL